MHRNFRIIDGKLTEVLEGAAPIVVYVDPDADERRYLVQDLKIDEHTLGSALDPDELARLEFEPEHAAVIFKQPKSYRGGGGSGSFLLDVISIGAFLFHDRLILVAADDSVLADGARFGRVTSLNDVLLRMIYRSIFHFLEHLKIIDKISDGLQAKINASMENRYLINLFELQKSLVYYLSSISSNEALIEKLKLNGAKLSFSNDELDVLDDVYIENKQCYKQAEVNSNILASLMDARVSIVSNNLNILIKILNIVTIALMVPTLVVSVFSMNVRLPMQDRPWAFWVILGLAMVALGSFGALMRFKRW